MYTLFHFHLLRALIPCQLYLEGVTSVPLSLMSCLVEGGGGRVLLKEEVVPDVGGGGRVLEKEEVERWKRIRLRVKS